MKWKSIKRNDGLSTLEILISFAILSMCMSAIILVIFGNQSITVSSRLNNEAIYKTKKTLENARALSRKDFSSLLSTSTKEISGNITYDMKLTVTDLTQCKKQATTTTQWMSEKMQLQKIELGTTLSDFVEAQALGGDCIDSVPTSNWDNPTRFASDSMNPGKPTSLDELNRFVYIGADKSPFMYIASTTYAVLNQNSNLFLSYTNGFDLKHTPNSLDAVRYQNLSKTYVFGAIASSTKQLAVIDVTNPRQPTVSYKGLSNCVTGSAPQGYLVYYYKNGLYLTTLYTAGPELHIFDATDPTNVTEYPLGSAGCRGYELGDSVNDIAVDERLISGVTKRFLYLATDEIDKEIRVFDVTNPTSISEVNSANQNLPGAQNGMSLYIVGNKLYFGRQSNPSGADLYIFDISNPLSGLTLLGSADIGTGVNAIRIAGRFAFIATPKVNQEFQVWNISSTTNITNIAVYNFGNVVNRGIDYDPDFIYSTGQSTPNFQILYSP